MDITPVFGTVVPGSNPGGSTKMKAKRAFLCSRSITPARDASGFESPEYVLLAGKTTRSGPRNFFVTTKKYLWEKFLAG